MRSLVHLSDLHFGTVDSSFVDPLVLAIQQLKPDLIAVSGDLTQRATPEEFLEARDFLQRLPGKQMVVPGNHDMSFYNPFRRLTQRLHLFREYIASDREPYYEDEEIALLGMNTVRVEHLRDGRMSEGKVRRLEEKMAGAPANAVRILMTHHPFDLPEKFPAGELVGRARRVFARVVACADLLLAGHMHVSHAGNTAGRYKIEGHSAVFVQAGTALSTRGRGEANSFNAIRIERPRIVVDQFAWHEDLRQFALLTTSTFEESPSGWAHKQEEVKMSPEEVAK